MALEYWAAHDPFDLEEGKASQLRYVLAPREGKGVTQVMQPGLGRKVSLLLSLVYW